MSFVTSVSHGFTECDSEVDSVLLEKNASTIEEWSWPESEYYGFVIGEGGSSIDEIEKESGAKVTFVEEMGKCFIRGNEDQRKKAKRLMKNKIKNHPNYVDDSYTELDFVKPGDIGKVIGKKGKNIIRLRERYYVVLKVVKRNDERDRVYIKGNPNEDTNVKECMESVKRQLAFDYESLFYNVECLCNIECTCMARYL